MSLKTEDLTVSFQEVRYRFFIYRYRPLRQQVLAEVVVNGGTGRWNLGASFNGGELIKMPPFRKSIPAVSTIEKEVLAMFNELNKREPF